MKSDVTTTTSNVKQPFATKAANTTCRSCGHKGLKPVLDLGVTALVDTLVPKERLSGPENKYPLQVGFCPKCALMQACDTPPPEEVFHSDYTYYASFSTSWLEHSRKCVLKQIERFKLNKNSFVVELASNDGYLLKNYVEEGIPVLGIDPAIGPVKAAEKIGVPTMHAFFTLDLAKKLAAEGKRADVIHANNVMAHVADFNGFIAGIATILKDSGSLVTESPYVKDLIDHCEFDTIYHEHLCYYGVTLAKEPLRSPRLVPQRHRSDPDARRIDPSVCFEEARRERDRKEAARRRAASWGSTSSASYYQSFATRVESIKTQMLKILRDLKKQGKRVAAYGASAKGSTMLSYLNAGPELIEFVVDKNVHKHGKFMPGVHNPILDVTAIAERKPDYLVLLVWNLKDEILKQQDAYRKAGGKFIIPIPTPTIV